MNRRHKRVAIILPASGLFGATGSARSSHHQALKLAQRFAAHVDTEVVVIGPDIFSVGRVEGCDVEFRHLGKTSNERAVAARSTGGKLWQLIWRTILVLHLLIGMRLLRWRLRPNVVISFITLTNLISLFSWQRGSVVVCERSDFERKRSPLALKWAAVRAYRRARAVVANHPDTAEFFAHVVGDVPCWFVPNFLNFQGSSDYKSHVLNSTSLVMVGRLSSEKHHGFVIQSLQELKLRYPDIQLEILGDGDEESRLRKLSRDLGLADRVHFRGHVSDVASVVGRSQLLILASEFEGLPNVCLEAMDLGTPCLVSSNVSSMPRLFATGKHFLQFQHLDDNDFVEQCVRALEDPSYIQNVVDGARRAVHDLCSSDDVFATWLRIAI